MSLEEQQEEQKVTNHYRVEITEFQEDSQDSEDEAGRIVHWPPPPASSAKEGEFVQKLESNAAKTTVAKYSKFNMEDEQQQQQLKSPLASDHFRPGKMNVSAVYNPTDSYQPITQQDDGQPAKRKVMSFDSVMQASNTSQHRTYHVPPGTTRTRRAQEKYAKHLKPDEK